MKTTSIALSFALTITAPLAFWGCGPNGETNSDSQNGSDVSGENGHHPEEGPHHGHLVELGDHEYHAEIVHDDAAETVTVYILDQSAKKQVPVDATEAVINLKHDGKPEQFKLPAVPDRDDPEGQSSRFQLQDEELAHDLDAEGAEPKLVVRIGGKSYTGPIEHKHHE